MGDSTILVNPSSVDLADYLPEEDVYERYGWFNVHGTKTIVLPGDVQILNVNYQVIGDVPDNHMLEVHYGGNSVTFRLTTTYEEPGSGAPGDNPRYVGNVGVTLKAYANYAEKVFAGEFLANYLPQPTPENPEEPPATSDYGLIIDETGSVVLSTAGGPTTIKLQVSVDPSTGALSLGGPPEAPIELPELPTEGPDVL